MQQARGEIRPDFFEDISKFQQLPVIAIEVISSSRNIQAMIEKAKLMVRSGIKSVWTIEPYGRSIFVSSNDGEKLFHEEIVEYEGISIDFAKVFMN